MHKPSSSPALRLAAQAAPDVSPRPRPRPRTGGAIGVIWNPRSHQNAGGAAPIGDLSGMDVATPLTKAALAQALARFADAGIDTLIIKGGDGTVRDVLTYGGPIFGNAWPRLMMVPRGKTNALAI